MPNTNNKLLISLVFVTIFGWTVGAVDTAAAQSKGSRDRDGNSAPKTDRDRQAGDGSASDFNRAQAERIDADNKKKDRNDAPPKKQPRR